MGLGDDDNGRLEHRVEVDTGDGADKKHKDGVRQGRSLVEDEGERGEEHNGAGECRFDAPAVGAHAGWNSSLTSPYLAGTS